MGIRDVQEKIQHWVGRCSIRTWKSNVKKLYIKTPENKQQVSSLLQNIQCDFSLLPSLASTGLMTCARLSALIM